MIASSNKEIEDEASLPNHPDHDLETSKDDVLDFINSQHHTDNQVDQVLQTHAFFNIIFLDPSVLNQSNPQANS